MTTASNAHGPQPCPLLSLPDQHSACCEGRSPRKHPLRVDLRPSLTGRMRKLTNGSFTLHWTQSESRVRHQLKITPDERSNAFVAHAPLRCRPR